MVGDSGPLTGPVALLAEAKFASRSHNTYHVQRDQAKATENHWSTTNVTKTPSLHIVRTSVVPWHETLLAAEFPSQVLKITIILTGAFDDVAVRHQAHLFLYCPGLGINLWVIDRNNDFHVPVVCPAETFGDMQRIRSRLARLIQPCLSIETEGVDNQGVAIPLAGGIT